MNFYKNLSLEKINKILLLLGFASLIYRWGNFYNTYLPKPYEIILSVVLISTVVDLIRRRKLRDFYKAIPRNIWTASFVLVGSVLVGWLCALLFKNIPIAFNTVLEFGTFIISLVSFVLTLYYGRSDEKFRRQCLYLLLLPVLYVPLLFFPEVAKKLYLVPDLDFAGFTLNVNIISKILLIPGVFFTAYALMSTKRNIKALCIFLAAGVFSLLIWTSSRGAIFSFLVAILAVLTFYGMRQFSWRKSVIGGVAILSGIIILGILLAPGYSRIKFLGRVIGNDEVSRIAARYPENSLITKILFSSHSVEILNQNDSTIDSDVGKNETRLIIWPIYIAENLKHPFGIGPNTHYNYYILRNGKIFNTGPHNTYLQVWQWGGIVGLGAFLYILWFAFRNLNRRFTMTHSPATLALLGALLAISLAIAFDDSLNMYWFFIILGLSLKE